MNDKNVERIAVIRLGGGDETPIVGICQPGESGSASVNALSFGSNSSLTRLPRGVSTTAYTWSWSAQVGNLK
jgi:hypothetical protein